MVESGGVGAGGEGSSGSILACSLTCIVCALGGGAAGTCQAASTTRCSATAASAAQAMPCHDSGRLPTDASAPALAGSGADSERWSVSNDNTWTLPVCRRPACPDGTRPDLHLSTPGS